MISGAIRKVQWVLPSVCVHWLTSILIVNMPEYTCKGQNYSYGTDIDINIDRDVDRDIDMCKYTYVDVFIGGYNTPTYPSQCDTNAIL